jgi:mannose-1-phosphate guanylyltransferase
MIGVILAGGSGTRFWPMSRRDRPKQLVELWGDAPMIQHALDRLDVVEQDDVPTFVVLGEHLLDVTSRALGSLDDDQFIVEPCPRNTGPAIALAAAYVENRFGDEPFGVFPADHFVGGHDRFRECLALAESRARDGVIVTMGIEPTRPETGYGYIQYENSGDDGLSSYPVSSFKEKPSRRVAERYLDEGGYAWNSGMFVMTPSKLFDEMQRQLPDMADKMREIRGAIGTDEERAVIDEVFSSVQSVSIDYGIMEGADDVEVIPATFEWSDVGHWASIEEVCEPDARGNVSRGDTMLIDTTNSVVYSADTDRFIATIGLDEYVVVDTPDAMLVMPKKRAQDVREVVRRLEERGRDDVL